MTDLGALAAAPQPQQVVQPNLLAPVTVDTQAVDVPGTDGYVAVQVMHSHGAFVFGLPSAVAQQFAERILAVAGAARSGLTIVGTV